MQPAHGGKTVVFHQRHHLRVHGPRAARGAKSTVVHMTAGAARDLAHLGRAQRAVPDAVKLALGGKGDMVNIHVQAHPDGVGGDQVIHLTGLIQRHLGIAGARAERAHDHRRTAPLPAHQLRQGIDIRGGKRDNSAALGQPRKLLFAGVGQHGKARSLDKFSLGQQAAYDRLHGVGAEEHGFLLAARAQQPVGEDMAPFRIGAKLYFIHGQKIYPPR